MYSATESQQSNKSLLHIERVKKQQWKFCFIYRWLLSSILSPKMSTSAILLQVSNWPLVIEH